MGPYDLNYYVIEPWTLPKGIWLSCSDPVVCKKGDLIDCIRAEGGAQGGILGSGQVVESYLDGQEILVDVERGNFSRGDSVVVKKGIESRLQGRRLQFHISFVGLFTNTPQKHCFFVSHWWGEPVLHFIKIVTTHAGLHRFAKDTAYWVCAYANDQHALSEEVSDDPMQSSFCRAMMGDWCIGVLLVLNSATENHRAAMPFERVWCAFEAYICLTLPRRSDLVLDVGTVVEGDAQILSADVTDTDIEVGVKEEAGGAA